MILMQRLLDKVKLMHMNLPRLIRCGDCVSQYGHLLEFWPCRSAGNIRVIPYMMETFQLASCHSVTESHAFSIMKFVDCLLVYAVGRGYHLWAMLFCFIWNPTFWVLCKSKNFTLLLITRIVSQFWNLCGPIFVCACSFHPTPQQ